MEKRITEEFNNYLVNNYLQTLPLGTININYLEDHIKYCKDNNLNIPFYYKDKEISNTNIEEFLYIKKVLLNNLNNTLDKPKKNYDPDENCFRKCILGRASV